jgi:hypothetical protein
MTDIVETRLNDTPYSMTSCAWTIAGAPYIGITALDYDDTRERKLVHAGRRDGTPLGLTSGQYKVGDVSITMLRSSAQRLIESLSALGLGSFGDARFPITATYSDPFATSRGVLPIVVVIDGCAVTGVKESYATGIDELVTQLTIQALTLTRNGFRLWSLAAGLGI